MSERQYGIDPSMVWLDLENNKEHLKKDGEHYVVDATLLNLRQENERLKMENDRLLKAMNFQDLELGRMADNRDMLYAENEKLRKLVYDMWYEGAFEPGACYVKVVDRLKERTRELGVKVPE